MKLVVYSNKKSQFMNIGWHRGGEEIVYYHNGILKESHSMYTLRFAYTFEYSQDIVWFAYNYPYTYTQLNEFLNRIESNRSIAE